jgi:predicted hotdog family 3-hydroxylacyl-ACP dehydratase
MSSFPPVEELVPHRGGMSLVRDVLEHGPGHTVCAVDPAGSDLFRSPDGSIPAWLSLEFMAQCIAAHGGLDARERGEPPSVGFFVGTRRIALHADRFLPGEVLRVRAEQLRRSGGLLSFACSVTRDADGVVLAEGHLNVFLPKDLSALAAEPETPRR